MQLFKGQLTSLSPSDHVATLGLRGIECLRRQGARALLWGAFCLQLNAKVSQGCSLQDADPAPLPSLAAILFRTGSNFSQSELAPTSALSEEEFSEEIFDASLDQREAANCFQALPNRCPSYFLSEDASSLLPGVGAPGSDSRNHTNCVCAVF